MAAGAEKTENLSDRRVRSNKQAKYWRRLRGTVKLVTASKTAMAGLALVLFWVLVALFSLITTMDPYAQDVDAINAPPSRDHLLGTDDIGRDILARLVHGSRLILTLAPLSVLGALLMGSTLGLAGGYFGGIVDEVSMRILDAMMALPNLLLYMIIVAALGPSAVNVVIAYAIGASPGIARLVRSLTLDIRSQDYIAAAELRNEHPLYIMFVEILPNARGPVIVDAMMRVGYAVFAIGTLGFLGLGVPPPSPDWGSMVARARAYFFSNPWAAVWPALAISSLVIGLNLFADGLREESLRYQ
jgi:peptide/nickel transport system permease protein